MPDELAFKLLYLKTSMPEPVARSMFMAQSVEDFTPMGAHLLALGHFGSTDSPTREEELLLGAYLTTGVYVVIVTGGELAKVCGRETGREVW